MRTAYEQDEERKEFGENARKFAEKNFNWDVLTDQLEKQILKTAIEIHPLGGMSRVI
jgi:glycosyltransferase involved in cell wall biosynthesis